MYYIGWLVALGLLLRGSTLQTIQAIPPRAPIQCKGSTLCTLYNSYGPWGDRKDCNVKNVAYPTTEEELRSAVAYANRNKLKVKVVSKFSHTIPKLACPSTDDALLISTAKYDSHIDIDSANLVVTADAGVALRQLIDKVRCRAKSGGCAVLGGCERCRADKHRLARELLVGERMELFMIMSLG